LGIGDWGLGIGDWGLGPIPNPQSPIPNPHEIYIFFEFIQKDILKYLIINKKIYHKKYNNYIKILLNEKPY